MTDVHSNLCLKQYTTNVIHIYKVALLDFLSLAPNLYHWKYHQPIVMEYSILTHLI